MAEPQVYRVGVIGCGRAGTTRARAFDVHPRCEVVAIADTDPENLALGCERFGVAGYTTWDEMLSSEELDITMPVLPVEPNADAVVASAQAGVRAIFCEKPLTARLSEADRMVEECANRGVPLAAGVMVSSHADYLKAYALAADGEIGQVRRINLYEGNGQGGCHGLNLARKCAGKAPIQHVIGKAEGDASSDYEEPYDDAVTGFGRLGGVMCFANGIECYSSYGEITGCGIEVVGDEGVIRNWNNTALGLSLWKRGPERPHGLVEVRGAFEPWREEPRRYDAEGWLDPGQVMRGIVDDIVRALDTGEPLQSTTGDDLRHALEMAIALRESHRRGHAEVALPLEDRSLVMYPERSRWHYKKQIHGPEWYREQMSHGKRD